MSAAAPRLARHRVINNDIAPLVLAEDEAGGLRALWMDADLRRALAGVRDDRRWRSDLARRLTAYFRGESVAFDDVPTPAGPAFHAACWAACRAIPRGETWSYSRLAETARSGSGATRAAGQAMRRNPLAVIVPCHRVVASDGGLHGYAGSASAAGPERRIKRALLAREGAVPGAGGGSLFPI